MKKVKALKVMLHELSWTEAKEYFIKNDIAILPVGSNEQHGPQNPLGTDHLIAKALAEETAKRRGSLSSSDSLWRKFSSQTVLGNHPRIA